MNHNIDPILISCFLAFASEKRPGRKVYKDPQQLKLFTPAQMRRFARKYTVKDYIHRYKKVTNRIKRRIRDTKFLNESYGRDPFGYDCPDIRDIV